MRIIRYIFLPFTLLACLAVIAAAQTPPKPGTQVRVAPAPPRVPTPRTDSEMRMAVDPNVNVKFCVSEAELKINGWNRDEVRVFVRDGWKFNMKVLEKDKTSTKPNWLWITPAEPEAGSVPGYRPECLSGRTVEIDLPMNSSLNITGRSTETTIDSVKKVEIKIVEGGISMRNISGGISAFAYQGDLTVENSAGSIAVETTTGNVIAYDVTPGNIGEVFRVRTNSGTVMMQNVEHRQIEANSITGAVNFDGKFLPGGVYSFKTSNGSIRLLLPDDTSAMFEAIYGFGSFNSDYPLEYTMETKMPTGQKVVARLGSGDSNVKLTTNSGTIHIFKKK
ncbi:MAG: DUF4097 family beta strand repeat-containing protein [Pyrinomonadaceae bacterium]|nr:DUF4097 family beta strand repeat-containing protein [Pyrinomonadaceae bacterium]